MSAVFSTKKIDKYKEHLVDEIYKEVNLKITRYKDEIEVLKTQNTALTECLKQALHDIQAIKVELEQKQC